MTDECFIRDVLANRFNRAILERWEALALPDGWLVAGCLFQTVWNLQSGSPPEARIKDYDIFYFDARDLSAKAEQQVQSRVNLVFADLSVTIEAKNQARVHTWYEAWFGHPYPELRNSKDGIDRFLVPATCVGIRPSAQGHEVYAPYGLEMLSEGVLTPNLLTHHADLFRAKAASYRDRWPWLRVAPMIGHGNEDVQGSEAL